MFEARAIKALHREFEPLDEGYALRERSEAYTREFNGENAARRAENTMLGMKILKLLRHSVVRPGCVRMIHNRSSFSG
jgi:hypothetical protein